VKSYVTTVLTLYSGIIDDASTQWPDIRASLGRDLSHLRGVSENRGLEYFTLTLPSLGPWFDRSLDRGYLLPESEIPRGIKRSRGRPCLFRGVLGKIFGADGALVRPVDFQAVLFYRTLLKVCGKLEYGVQEVAMKESIEGFINVDNHLPPPYPSTWGSDVPAWRERHGHPLRGGCDLPRSHVRDLLDHALEPNSELPWDTLRTLCRRVTSQLGELDWWNLRPKHGPGAVSEGRRESKYDFPTWPQKLDRVFPFDWYGSSSLEPDTFPSDRDTPSRLIAVPKDRKAPRLICAEPTSNQYMQQSIWRFLEERVNRTVLGRSITFRSQEASQIAALSGSASKSNATLDLSEASDRVSCRLVEYIFQGSSLLDAFHACRTDYVEQTLHSGANRLIKLHKFSTMGSALTFPVQSIIFTILCVWAYRLYHGREDDWSNWEADFDQVRVFGDDLIVPREAYRLTTFVLHECGLRINPNKSYSGDNFRESCGCDAFRGVDVTPPRHRRMYDGSAPSTAALIDFSNNLHMKGFWRTADLMLSLVPLQERKLLWVSGSDEAALGLKTFCKDPPRPRLRWDRNLQRFYGVRLSFSTKVSRTHGSGAGRLLQFFIEDPASRRDHSDVVEWLPGQPVVDRLRKGRSRVYL